MGNWPSKRLKKLQNGLGESLMEEGDYPSMADRSSQNLDETAYQQIPTQVANYSLLFQDQNIPQFAQTLQQAIEFYNEAYQVSQFMASAIYGVSEDDALNLFDQTQHQNPDVFLASNSREYCESVELMNTFTLMSISNIHPTAVVDPVCLVEMNLNQYMGQPQQVAAPIYVPEVQRPRQGPIEVPVQEPPPRIERIAPRVNLNQLGIQVDQVDDRAMNARRAAIMNHVQRRLHEFDFIRREPLLRGRDESQIDSMLHRDPELHTNIIECQGGKRMLKLSIKPQRRGAHTDCIICQDQVSKTEANVAILECLHWFHFECFEVWGRTNPVCPCCKQDAVFVHVTSDPEPPSPARQNSQQGSGIQTPIQGQQTPPNKPTSAKQSTMSEKGDLEAIKPSEFSEQPVANTAQYLVAHISDLSAVGQLQQSVVVANMDVSAPINYASQAQEVGDIHLNLAHDMVIEEYQPDPLHKDAQTDLANSLPVQSHLETSKRPFNMSPELDNEAMRIEVPQSSFDPMTPASNQISALLAFPTPENAGAIFPEHISTQVDYPPVIHNSSPAQQTNEPPPPQQSQTQAAENPEAPQTPSAPAQAQPTEPQTGQPLEAQQQHEQQQQPQQQHEQQEHQQQQQTQAEHCEQPAQAHTQPTETAVLGQTADRDESIVLLDAPDDGKGRDESALK